LRAGDEEIEDEVVAADMEDPEEDGFDDPREFCVWLLCLHAAYRPSCVCVCVRVCVCVCVYVVCE